MKSITYITGNPNKAAQAKKYIGDQVLHKNIDLIEIQSMDSEEIISHKVKEAYKKLKTPVLVEDVSFVIPTLGNFPGPMIKWVEKEVGYERLCKIVTLFKDKKAFAKVTFALFDGKVLKTFSAKVSGTVADSPKAGSGFGFDYIFIPEGYTTTRSQMSEKDYDKTNHRRMGLEKVKKFLKNGK